MAQYGHSLSLYESTMSEYCLRWTFMSFSRTSLMMFEQCCSFFRNSSISPDTLMVLHNTIPISSKSLGVISSFPLAHYYEKHAWTVEWSPWRPLLPSQVAS